MHTAPVQVTQLPQNLLIGWVQVAQRLTELGINITHVPMPSTSLGELNEATSVLEVRDDADPEDQVWLLQQVWNWLAIGPHGSPFARVQPLLRLVLPEQRGDDHPA